MDEGGRLSAANEPPDDFLGIRAQCETLLEHEAVDKDVALGILRLFHTAETKLLEARHEQKREAERLRHDLELVKVTHQNTQRISALVDDVERLKATRDEDARAVSELFETVEMYKGTVEKLVAMQSAVTGKRRA